MMQVGEVLYMLLGEKSYAEGRWEQASLDIHNVSLYPENKNERALWARPRKDSR